MKLLILGFLFFAALAPLPAFSSSCKGSFKKDSLELFEPPKSSEGMPHYIDKLESALNSPDSRLALKELAVQLLGVIGKNQPEFSIRAARALTEVFKSRPEEDLKDKAMEQAFEIVMARPSDPLYQILTDSLFFVVGQKGSHTEKYQAIQFLKDMGIARPEKALLISQRLLKSALGEEKPALEKKERPGTGFFGSKAGEALIALSGPNRGWRNFKAQVSQISPLVRQRRGQIASAISGMALGAPKNIREDIVKFLKEIYESSSEPEFLRDLALSAYGKILLHKINQPFPR